MLVAAASTPAILVGGGGRDISVGPMRRSSTSSSRLLELAWSRQRWIAVAILLVLGATGVINGITVGVLRFPR